MSVAEKTLTPEQKAVEAQAAADKKAADEKAEAIARADEEFRAAVNAAAEKRNKALEKFTVPTVDGITKAAYEATKEPGGPSFGEVQLDYRQKLRTHADSVVRTGLPERPTPFEEKVADLLTKKEYKDLTLQAQTPAGLSPVRESAEDYTGDEGEKGGSAKAKSDKK